MKGIAGFISLGLLTGLIFISASLIPVQAAARVEDSIQVVVLADNESSTSVDFQLTLRNTGNATTLLTDYYLNVGSLELDDVRLLTTSSDLTLRYEKKTNNNQLHFRFKNRSLGQGKSTTVRVQGKGGQLWESRGLVKLIRLPFLLSGFGKDSQITLRINRKLGTLLYSSHPFTEAKIDGLYTVHTYPVAGFRNGLFAFGEGQVYTLTTAYDLQNQTAVSEEKVISLPSISQHTFPFTVNSFDPLPSQATLLSDHNVKALYLLKANEKKRVNISFKYYFSPTEEAKVALLAEDVLNYQSTTGALTMSPATNRRISASTILTGNRPPSERVEAVTNWILESYSLTTAAQQQFRNHEYLSAQSLNEIATASGGRLTNVYDVALLWLAGCRLKEVPCRLVYGVVYSYITTGSKASTMQLWGQYYDSTKERWVSVDPILAMATGVSAYELDLTHVPLFELDPNRDYSLITQQVYEAQPDGQVPLLSREVTIETTEPSLEQAERRFWEPINSSLIVRLRNNGNMPVILQGLSFKSEDLDVNWETESVTEQILYPGAVLTFPLNIEIPPRLSSSTHFLEITGQISYGQTAESLNKRITLNQTGDREARLVYYAIVILVGGAGVFALLIGFRYFNGWLNRHRSV